MLRIVFLAAFLILSLSSCKDSKVGSLNSPGAVVVPKAVERPQGLLGTLHLPSGDNAAEIGVIADGFQSGVSGMLNAQMPLVLGQMVSMDLSDADLSKPVAILLLSPKVHDAPAALLVHLKDLPALEAKAKEAEQKVIVKGELALIGPPAVVDAAEEYAFDDFSKPSDSIQMVFFPRALRAVFEKEISEGFEEISSAVKKSGQSNSFMPMLMESYKEALVAMTEQSDRVVVTMDRANKRSSLYFQLYPLEGTMMEAFVQAQEPSQHDLLMLLPAQEKQSILFSGDMKAGAASETIQDFFAEFMVAMYQGVSGADAKRLMARWLDASDGRWAGSIDMSMNLKKGALPTIHMNYLLGVTDEKKMRQAWRDMMMMFSKGLVQMKGDMVMDADFKENVRSIAGVEVDLYKTKTQVQLASGKEVMEQNMYIAVLDNLAFMSTDNKGGESMKLAIEAAQGKAPRIALNAISSGAIAFSRERKESMMMIMDIVSLVGEALPIPLQAVEWGMGKDGKALSLRFSALQ